MNKPPRRSYHSTKPRKIRYPYAIVKEPVYTQTVEPYRHAQRLPAVWRASRLSPQSSQYREIAITWQEDSQKNRKKDPAAFRHLYLIGKILSHNDLRTPPPLLERGPTGDERTRTADLLVANQSLSRLSYVPDPDDRQSAFPGRVSARPGPDKGPQDTGRQPGPPDAKCFYSKPLPTHPGLDGPSTPKYQWAWLDSNQRPLPYQGSALTN